MHRHTAETALPGYRSSIIHEIYDVMCRTPDAIALTDGDLEWTYDALRKQSNIVARCLADRKINRGDVVGMHLARSADAIAVMLGIMASGCVYLPLDPSYPAARLRAMLDQAEAVAVVSHEHEPDLCGPHRTWFPPPSQLPAESEMLASGPSIFHADDDLFGPDDCAYILFTSGSTGLPKGVMVSHENITLMNDWSAKALGFTPLDSTATTCSLSFDPSFHEILLPLSVGGTVHVISHALALGQLARPVSLIATTPTVANELLRAGQLPPLKTLMLGGEALAPDIAALILSSGLVGTLFNCYGPTECTVCVTMAEITAPVPAVIPIGRQVPSVEVRILGEQGQRLADGELGEICVFGRQVALGYVNDTAGTAERFTLGTGAAAERQRCYCTGDLGYRTGDGTIYFAGRVDRQVKINGIRIELGEIDATLRSHPEIADAVTLIRPGDRTVAYVVPARSDIDSTNLRQFLAERLPPFMVPAGIVVVAEIPKTINGKLDDSALPEWPPSRPERELLAPDYLDQFTAHVIKIVSEVTGFVGQIHPADDLINDLGGTSLDIIRVMVEMERYSGRRLHISHALADPSVAGLARLLREETVSPAADFAFNTDGDAPPLFLIHVYLGGMLKLRRLAELLPLDQPVYGLHVYSGTEPYHGELTISSLAEKAAERIRRIQPPKGFSILGPSAGGIVAFEAARRLVAAGDAEPRVLLLDTPRPFTFGYDWGEWVMDWRDNLHNPGRVFRAGRARLYRALRSNQGRSQVDLQADDLITLNERNVESIGAALRRHRVQSYGGDITVMCTRQGRLMALGRRALGWASVTDGALSVLDVPGAHLTMLNAPHLQSLAEKLIDWLGKE